MTVRPDYGYGIEGVIDRSRLDVTLQEKRREVNSTPIPVQGNYRTMHPEAAGITVSFNGSVDGTFNKSYAVTAGAFPADWPVEMHSAPKTMTASTVTSDFAKTNASQCFSTITDGIHIAFFSNVPNANQFLPARVYVDGYFVAAGNYTINGNRYINLTFADSRPRRIDILSAGSFGVVLVKNPYRAWKPPKERYSALAVGDSSVQSSAAAATYTQMYPRVFSRLGLINHTIDGRQSTGFLQDGSGSNYLKRLRSGNDGYKPYDIDHNLIVVQGGGANDLVNGYTIDQIVAQAKTYFRELAVKCPNAKIVFVEGFLYPTGFTGFGPSYQSIREQLQRDLTDVGIYYVNTVGTNPAWLYGTGYAGATNGSGNTDLYIGADGIHPNQAGENYVGQRMEAVLEAILADNGKLVNTLI